MTINISTSSRVFWWRPAAWLQIGGEDAANFLQGQFTNDLRSLGKMPAVYGLWLNVKGKVLADSFVLRGGGPNEFWIGSYFSSAKEIRERLESFVIADDVSITDATTDWAGVSLFDGGATTLPTGPAEGGFVFPGRRTKAGSVEWVFPVAEMERVRKKISGAAELTGEEVARERITAGIPAVPVDLGPGDLPNEAGVEAEAISYTKGCYLGAGSDGAAEIDGAGAASSPSGHGIR